MRHLAIILSWTAASLLILTVRASSQGSGVDSSRLDRLKDLEWEHKALDKNRDPTGPAPAALRKVIRTDGSEPSTNPNEPKPAPGQPLGANPEPLPKPAPGFGRNAQP